MYLHYVCTVPSFLNIPGLSGRGKAHFPFGLLPNAESTTMDPEGSEKRSLMKNGDVGDNIDYVPRHKKKSVSQSDQTCQPW